MSNSEFIANPNEPLPPAPVLPARPPVVYQATPGPGVMTIALAVFIGNFLCLVVATVLSLCLTFAIPVLLGIARMPGR